MKILHTADWHIGQTFHDFERTYEHQQFLDWLIQSLQDQRIDVLLISGDVFDTSNPSAAATKMFYSFLSSATSALPDLQIIVTAGNHDSGSRLETPKPLLGSTNIHIVGVIEKNEDGGIRYDNLIIPVKNAAGEVAALCLAVPFLRMGDYPVVPGSGNPYMDGVIAFYEGVYEAAVGQLKPGQAIIGMGHLHALQAEITDMDKSERQIMGGVECIPVTAFDGEIKYMALGHIHKAQRVGGRDTVRYCGSPIPMSFSEINYKHQVTVFDLVGATIENIRSVDIPISIPLVRVPDVHSNMEEVLAALQQLPDHTGDVSLAPYLEVRVLEEGPDPGRRSRIESAIAGKHVRLARINVRRANAESEIGDPLVTAQVELDSLQPVDVFTSHYSARYSSPVPEELLRLFQQVTEEANQIQ